MKSFLKYSHIFCITLFLLTINMILSIVFRNQIELSAYSLLPIAMVLLVSVNGVLACIFKHKGNFLIIRTHRTIFTEEKDYTFTDEYEREFRIMLLVYCAAIPFYIPIILFSSSLAQSLWTFFVFCVPQGGFFIYDLRKTIKNAKDEKLRRAQLEKERMEQERREELGHWK